MLIMSIFTLLSNGKKIIIIKEREREIGEVAKIHILTWLVFVSDYGIYLQ